VTCCLRLSAPAADQVPLMDCSQVHAAFRVEASGEVLQPNLGLPRTSPAILQFCSQAHGAHRKRALTTSGQTTMMGADRPLSSRSSSLREIAPINNKHL
jgi:hypothetical protein